MKRLVLVSLVLMLLAAALLQWGVDNTPAGTNKEETGDFPAASSLLDLLGGARQYLAFTYYIKSDKLHHVYYGSLDQEAELVPYFKIIALMDPHYVSAYYVGASIMQLLGKGKEAIDFTLQGLEANPTSADLYYSLGDFYLQEKRYAEAREAFEEALKYDSELVSHGMILTALAASCKAMGDMEAWRRHLMEKAIYNRIRLYGETLSYEQGKEVLQVINRTINTVMSPGGDE